MRVAPWGAGNIKRTWDGWVGVPPSFLSLVGVVRIDASHPSSKHRAEMFYISSIHARNLIKKQVVQERIRNTVDTLSHPHWGLNLIRAISGISSIRYCHQTQVCLVVPDMDTRRLKKTNDQCLFLRKTDADI